MVLEERQSQIESEIQQKQSELSDTQSVLNEIQSRGGRGSSERGRIRDLGNDIDRLKQESRILSEVQNNPDIPDEQREDYAGRRVAFAQQSGARSLVQSRVMEESKRKRNEIKEKAQAEGRLQIIPDSKIEEFQRQRAYDQSYLKEQEKIEKRNIIQLEAEERINNLKQIQQSTQNSQDIQYYNTVEPINTPTNFLDKLIFNSYNKRAEIDTKLSRGVSVPQDIKLQSQAVFYYGVGATAGAIKFPFQLVSHPIQTTQGVFESVKGGYGSLRSGEFAKVLRQKPLYVTGVIATEFYLAKGSGYVLTKPFQKIRVETPLRKLNEPFAIQTSRYRVDIGTGKVSRLSYYKIVTEISPPRKVVETNWIRKNLAYNDVFAKKVFFIPEKTKVTTTPKVVIDEEPFMTTSFKPKGRAGEISLIKGRSKLKEMKELDSLNTFLLQTLAEKKAGRPVSKRNVKGILGDVTIYSGSLTEKSLLKINLNTKIIDYEKGYTGLFKYPKQRKTKTVKGFTNKKQSYLTLTEMKELPQFSTNLYNVYGGRTAFIGRKTKRVGNLKVTTFGRKTSTLKEFVVEYKEPEIVDSVGKSNILVFSGGGTQMSIQKSISKLKQRSISIPKSVLKQSRKFSKGVAVVTYGKQSNILIPVIQPRIKSEVNTKQIIKEVPSVKQKEFSVVIAKENQIQIPNQKTISKSKTIQKPIFKLLPKEEQKSIQKVTQKQIPKLIQKPILKLTPKNPPPRIPPKFPRRATKPFRFKLKNYSSKGLGSFNFTIFGRRFGKFNPIGTATSSGQAIKIGTEFAGKTLGATFKVFGKGFKSPKSLKGFTTKDTKQGRLFIEQPRYRLSTGTEKAEIKMFKQMKGGSKKKR